MRREVPSPPGSLVFLLYGSFRYHNDFGSRSSLRRVGSKYKHGRSSNRPVPYLTSLYDVFDADRAAKLRQDFAAIKDQHVKQDLLRHLDKSHENDSQGLWRVAPARKGNQSPSKLLAKKFFVSEMRSSLKFLTQAENWTGATASSCPANLTRNFLILSAMCLASLGYVTGACVPVLLLGEPSAGPLEF